MTRGKTVSAPTKEWSLEGAVYEGKVLTCAFEGRLHLVHAEEAVVVPVEVVERLPEFCRRGSTQGRSAQLVPRHPSEVLTPCEAALLVLDHLRWSGDEAQLPGCQDT